MTDLDVYEHGNWSVRTLLVDGDPWFIAADVCLALGFGNGRQAVTTHVDEVDRAVHSVDTPGGRQNVTIVNESGMYALIFGSRLDSAKTFKRWVTSEVLPALRRTGTYTVAPTEPAFPVPTSYAEALQLAADQARQLEQITERVAELEPAAEAWQALASADGDLSVRDAALILQRDGIDIGAQRLFVRLRELGWIDRSNRPLQQHCANGTGRVAELPHSYTDPDTGRTFISYQPRITVKGLADLRRILTADRAPSLQVVS